MLTLGWNVSGSVGCLDARLARAVWVDRVTWLVLFLPFVMLEAVYGAERVALGVSVSGLWAVALGVIAALALLGAVRRRLCWFYRDAGALGYVVPRKRLASVNLAVYGVTLFLLSVLPVVLSQHYPSAGAEVWPGLIGVTLLIMGLSYSSYQAHKPVYEDGVSYDE